MRLRKFATPGCVRRRRSDRAFLVGVVRSPPRRILIPLLPTFDLSEDEHAALAAGDAQGGICACVAGKTRRRPYPPRVRTSQVCSSRR
jgi:hypothetical protein